MCYAGLSGETTRFPPSSFYTDFYTETTKTTLATYLLLIRHGQNDWVGTNKLAGRTPGVHLNDHGREQSQALIEVLREQPISTVYSSPLERCRETAQPVAEALGLPVQTEPGVLEIDFGEWQGQSLKELSKLPDWAKVQHSPSTFRFPGGETFAGAQARAIATLERLRRRHENEVVAIFSHSDVIRLCVAHYIGTPIDLFQRIAIDTASISTLGFHDDRVMVLGVNRTAAMASLIRRPRKSRKMRRRTSRRAQIRRSKTQQ